jgi:bifunctional UDP-N-acetylglucosamine pyrophosphorylase/glucosamine-1-phosphate N-acetyltransferase
MAPYAECRPKALLPVVNRPVLEYVLASLAYTKITGAVIAVRDSETDVRQLVDGRAEVRNVGETTGTAMTLLRILEDDEAALVLYGDTLIEEPDMGALFNAAADGTASILVAPLGEGESRDWIAVSVADGNVTAILGHPREGAGHRPAGFVIPAGFRSWLEECPSRFPAVEVGMMPPAEHHLESALESYRAAGNPVKAVAATTPCFDLDKPWHILDANRWWVEKLCGSLSRNQVPGGEEIDPSAHLDGFVSLGAGSRIGRNVIIRGNLVVGENTVIDAGAIINGSAVIGSDSVVANACFIESGSVVGDECVVSHAAELDGVIFRGVYLYHYMEIYGVVGERSDIGAATVCGSLRFDDGLTVHRIKGRREIPRTHANATFIGDYCRTGVNATVMPGKRIGPYSIVGAGVVLENDLPPHTGVRVRQNLEEFSWGPERYGW